MRHPQQVQKLEPQIGEFTVRPAYDGMCRDLVVCKTGPRHDDYERFVACETRHAAEKLAALMNAARDLAVDWPQISQTAPLKGSDPKQWVLHLIVCAVARAIDGPKPDPFGFKAASYTRVSADDEGAA